MLQRIRVKLKQASRRGLLAVTALVVGITPVVAFAPKAYAVAEPAPVNLAAYTGGNSIGLVWQPAAGSTPTGYNVYRNSTLLASNVAPNSTYGPASLKTMRYVDTAVSGGTSYSYQVTALNALAEESGVSNTANATHPSSPAPVPTVTVTGTIPGDLVAYMNNIRTVLRDWYPKITTHLGGVASSPTSFNITIDSSVSAAAWDYANNTIKMNETFARNNMTNGDSDGVWMHEVTHVAQAWPSEAPSWVAEGAPAEVQSYMLRTDAPSTGPTGSQTYLEGYGVSGYFLNWIKTNYSATFAQDIHAAIQAADWDPNIFYAKTKLTLGELWTQMTSNRVSSQMVFTNSSGKCMNIPNFNFVAGEEPELGVCGGSDRENFTFVPDTYTGTVGAIKVRPNICFDVQSSGTTDGTRVWLYTCNGSVAQKWIIQSNGTLKNPNSGKCLQPVNGGTANGTMMEIRTCAGTGTQKWGVRPNFLLQNIDTGISLCVGTATGSNPAPSFSYVQNKACTYGESQLLEYVQASPGSNSGSYRIYGRSVCLDTTSAADNAVVIFRPCDGSSDQEWVRNPSTRLSNVGNNKCLQLAANSTAADAYLVTNTCNSNNSQKWLWATF